jgi:NADPH:quinone reductase-like Zn-dependent oxidoreductase
MVSVVTVQDPQFSSEMLAVAEEPPPALAVRFALIVDVVHESKVFPDVSVNLVVVPLFRLKSSTVLVAHGELQGLVAVEHRRPAADAVLVPPNASMAVAATATATAALMDFMIFPSIRRPSTPLT